jgi:hypothetical protein
LARLTLAAAFLVVGCHHSAPPVVQTPAVQATRVAPASDAAAAAPSIGTARLEADGTLVLLLRASTAGATGEGRFVYPPSHPQYRKILEHIGPIKPGEEKQVAPFPDE